MNDDIYSSRKIGLTADARTMIDHARLTAQNHSFTYDERIKVESATQAVCDLALRFGESMDNEDAMMVCRSVVAGMMALTASFMAVQAIWCRAIDSWYRRARPTAIPHRSVRNICAIRGQGYWKRF